MYLDAMHLGHCTEMILDLILFLLSIIIKLLNKFMFFSFFFRYPPVP